MTKTDLLICQLLNGRNTIKSMVRGQQQHHINFKMKYLKRGGIVNNDLDSLFIRDIRYSGYFLNNSSILNNPTLQINYHFWTWRQKDTHYGSKLENNSEQPEIDKLYTRKWLFFSVIYDFNDISLVAYFTLWCEVENWINVGINFAHWYRCTHERLFNFFFKSLHYFYFCAIRIRPVWILCIFINCSLKSAGIPLLKFKCVP